MKTNMGSTDRLIRLVLAAVLVVLFVTDTLTGTLGIVAVAAAVILALTSVVRFCPLYYPFGISTCGRA